MTEHVQFDEAQDLEYQNAAQGLRKSLLVRAAMALGAKNEKQANIVLLSIAVVFFTVSVVLFARLTEVGPFEQANSQFDLKELSPEFREAIENAR